MSDVKGTDQAMSAVRNVETAPMTPPDERKPLVTVRNLTMHFPIRSGLIVQRHVGEVRAVDGIDFELYRGETLGLVGESGCGKSTAGRALLRLYKPTAGSIDFDGVDLIRAEGEQLRKMRRRMQMIFQDPYASLDPRMTVGGIVAEPLEVHGVGTKRERTERVRELLETVGINPEYGDRYPHEFSGVSIQAQIMNLLERLQDRLGLSYLFIAHDLSAVRHISDRIAVMYLGKIVEVAPARELNVEPLHPYSVALLSAVPIPDPKVEARRRRIILHGDVPSPVNPPSGCRFHTRCWLRERLANPERCSADDPALRELRPGHRVACHFAEEVAGSIEQLQAIGTGAGAFPAGAEPSALSTGTLPA